MCKLRWNTETTSDGWIVQSMDYIFIIEAVWITLLNSDHRIQELDGVINIMPFFVKKCSVFISHVGSLSFIADCFFDEEFHFLYKWSALIFLQAFLIKISSCFFSHCIWQKSTSPLMSRTPWWILNESSTQLEFSYCFQPSSR